MKRETAVLALLALSVLFVASGSASLGSAATTRPRHPLVATSLGSNAVLVAVLPEIGTVYSRYSCTRGWRFALGVHVSGPQTTLVRIRTGGVSRDQELQPGQTHWFEYSLGRVQRLAATAAGENGEVYGWMRVTGYPRSGRNCSPYAPPRVTFQMYPRGYYRLSGYALLRHLIG